MSVTIKDIAKAAGVSTSTVSRALKDHYSISEETKQKIFTIMEELGYKSDKQVKKIKTIGVIFPKSQNDAYENPFYLEMIRGIGMICNQRNYTMNIITGANNQELVTSILNTRADGYIFLYSMLDDYLIDYMRKEKLLFIVIGKVEQPYNDILCVDTDNIQAAYEAVSYLISLGHSNIGYFGTSENKVFSFDRKTGYIQALNKHNIPVDDFNIFAVESINNYNSKRLKQVLTSNKRPTAFLVCDDIHALLLERLIREVNLIVPDDISIISFNNSIYAKLMSPALTSFNINSRQLGIEAANQLINHIENPNLFATKIIIPYTLVKRESCIELKK